MEIVKYYVADTSKLENELQVIKEIEVSPDEVESFYQHFSFLGNIVPAETAYRIAVKNYHEFLSFMTEQNLSMLYKRGISQNILLIESNRLIFNLCASIITFVDYSKNSLSGRKNAKEEFEEFLHFIFDSNLSYRFFYKLRNYCVHYAFPFSSVEIKEPFVVDIYCKKSLLMDYSGWGALVKKDIESMPEIIDIINLVKPLLGAIFAIDLDLYYFYSENYIRAYKSIGDLQKKYGVSDPVFLCYDDKDNMSLKIIPIKEIREGMSKLQMHPKVNIKIVPPGTEK